LEATNFIGWLSIELSRVTKPHGPDGPILLGADPYKRQKIPTFQSFPGDVTTQRTTCDFAAAPA
jgi:hypothetical protein